MIRIACIHAKYLDDNFGRVADYSAKTVKWARGDPDDILMLPKSLSEVKRTPSVLTPEDKAIKDIMSRHNVSEELARQMYQAQRRPAA